MTELTVKAKTESPYNTAFYLDFHIKNFNLISITTLFY